MLAKLGIENLNEMQKEAQHYFHIRNNILLLSPTGSGKTLAFLIPLIASLDTSLGVQAIIVAPTRELVIQIEQVAMDLGSGYKINAVYGGRSFSKDRKFLEHPPSILIATPGRLADHLRRGTIGSDHPSVLILDEFDKALEVGFEDEMKEILELLPNIRKKMLTSATKSLEIPDYLEFQEREIIDYLESAQSRLKQCIYYSDSKDKLLALGECLQNLKGLKGIVFCNYKDSIARISSYLEEIGIDHSIFYGGLEQIDRERSLIKFRNYTNRILLATDLAARGIDVDSIDFIIHYHLPVREEEFVHRNGRTARMHNEGLSITILWRKEPKPSYLRGVSECDFAHYEPTIDDEWSTVYISAGKRDKISKGDIAGFFFKQGKLKKDELGLIELKQECAFAAIRKKSAKQAIQLTHGEKIKNRKVNIQIV